MTSFDVRAAKLLKKGEWLLVDSCPGLRLQKMKTRTTWVYRYRATDGRLRQIKIGEWPAVGHPDAIAAWGKQRTARNVGGDPAVEKRTARQYPARPDGKQPVYTLKQLCNDYLTGLVEKHWGAKGQNEVRRMFDNMLGPLGAASVESITREQAIALIKARGKDAPTMAARLRGQLSAAWKHARENGLLPSDTLPNYWQDIMKQGKPLRSKGKKLNGKNIGTGKKILSDEQVGELLRWMPNFGDPWKDILTLYLWTGVRGAEIVAMEARDVKREKDGILWWQIPKAKTKNRNRDGAGDLRVPLFGRAEQIVSKRMKTTPNGYLFPRESRYTYKGDFPHIEQDMVGAEVRLRQPHSTERPNWDRLRLTVTNWAPHDLRRTTRTLLAKIEGKDELKCPWEVAEAIIGHMKKGLDGVYNLYEYDKERVKWLSVLSAYLEALAAGAER